MRLPGTKNVKHEPHVPCCILEADSRRRYPVVEVRRVLEQFAAQRNGCHEPGLQSPCSNVVGRARRYINKIPNVEHGQRNGQTYKVAAVCREFGLNQADSMLLLTEWNAGNAEPLDAVELAEVLKNADKYANKARGCKAESKTTSKRKRTAPRIEPHQPFPVKSLPDDVRRFVVEAADAIFCDPSFIALPMLGLLARAIGNRRVIRLKSTWFEPAIIWAAIVGKSGTHKTPAIKNVMRVLEEKQGEAFAKHNEAMLQYEQDAARYEAEFAVWKRRQTSRAKKSDPKDERDLAPWEPKAPVCERYIVSDITIEALADRLAGQFDGVLLVRDELAGWINGIAEYKGGKGSDTGHWLACWSAAPFTVDRKTGAQKMIHVPRGAVSIVGGIQPGILRQAIGREHMQDGLCARLLLASPEDRPVRWSDAVVSAGTIEGMEKLIEALLAMESGADAEGNPEPHPLPLTPVAKSVWVEYYDRHRGEIVDLDEDLAAAWSKLEAYTARFALIIQLCRDPAAVAVDEQSMIAAIALSDWFGRGHVRRGRRRPRAAGTNRVDSAP
jgi:hypothetical protein